jgi:ABC-type histidine transport system ATPase subunit
MGPKPIRWVVESYIEAIRNTPFLIQIGGQAVQPVLENCMLAPMKVLGTPKAAAEVFARQLAQMRLPEQPDKYPAQLSGGQQQRAAIARALHAARGHAV